MIKLKTQNSKLKTNKGIALIMVLWVITFLTIVASEFAYSMKVETDTTRNFKEDAEGYFLALAGINMALAEIMTDFDYNYLDKDNKMIFTGKGENVNIPHEFELGSGKVSYAIIDEESKININTASRDLIWNLMKALGIEITTRDVIADSILDWRDTNSDYHLNGAESDDFYLKLSHPYEAKNGGLDFYEELLLVKGITPDIFYGTKNVPQGINFANLQTDAETKTPEDYNSDFSGIHDYITSFGASQININTANEKVLEARFGAAAAEKILLQRKEGMVFQQPAYGGIAKSTAFTVIANGYAKDGKAFHQIQAVIEKKTGQKPEVRVRYWNDNI